MIIADLLEIAIQAAYVKTLLVYLLWTKSLLYNFAV